MTVPVCQAVNTMPCPEDDAYLRYHVGQSATFYPNAVTVTHQGQFCSPNFNDPVHDTGTSDARQNDVKLLQFSGRNEFHGIHATPDKRMHAVALGRNDHGLSGGHQMGYFGKEDFVGYDSLFHVSPSVTAVAQT
jgi:hypothetical protein